MRGIAPYQNIDPYISDVATEKLKEFGSEAKTYEKKASDMKKLTEIERKFVSTEKVQDAIHKLLNSPEYKKNIFKDSDDPLEIQYGILLDGLEIIKKKNQELELTKEELRFLYEMDSSIEGFGYQRDPRIDEIRSQRDEKNDYIKILGLGHLNLRPEEIALNYELDDSTVVFKPMFKDFSKALMPRSSEMWEEKSKYSFSMEDLNSGKYLNIYSLSKKYKNLKYIIYPDIIIEIK